MINRGKLTPKIKAILNSTKEKVAGAEKVENENKLSINITKLKRLRERKYLQERSMINLQRYAVVADSLG